ncbi:transcriptional regulator, HxlR family [Stackebrandtia nassauensis DSM 44728]|uniref:Transcriptional regulator, HxlR family n=2 Tax=Stackebrandtia TaxID=283810 RepID=D3Q692_STANL|nr:transcriptional regulator, HxlR family [Stackebrandtia nassauensis DSM 44728]
MMDVMALGKGYGNQDCSMARGLELVGERWTLLIVRDAFYGVRRFSDFLAHLEIPRAVLSERLQYLTDMGVLSKDSHEGSTRAEYALTDTGLALWPVLASLSQWSNEYLHSEAGPYLIYEHDPCGTELADRLNCPTCGERVRLADIATSPGPAANRTRDDVVSRSLLKRRRLLDPIR